MFDLILVDFSWIYNKYYYVTKTRPMRTLKELQSDEYLVPTLSDRLLRLFNLIGKNYPTSRVLLVLDPPLSSTENFALCEDYKQNRDKKEKEKVYKRFKDVVGTLCYKLSKRFTFVRAMGFEADQVIAYLAERHQADKKVLIFTGDKDMLQLSYYPNVQISDKYEKGSFELKTDKEIFEKFKNNKGEDFTRISTNKKDILKYRVLKGDTSDNLGPVFPRIKDTEIVDIIKNYWVSEDELTDVQINEMIKSIRETNSELAQKLRKSKSVWLRNYRMMNLFGLHDIPIKKVAKHV